MNFYDDNIGVSLAESGGIRENHARTVLKSCWALPVWNL